MVTIHQLPGAPDDYPAGQYVIIDGVGGTVTAAWRNPMQVIHCNVAVDRTIKPVAGATKGREAQ